MASQKLPLPLLRHVAKRYKATVPAVKPTQVQGSILPSGTFVAGVDNGSPVTRVSIAFWAGSRFEPAAELGISHVLRAAAGLSTCNASSFIISRKLAQIGASVTASGDREFVYYTLETTPNNLNAALECLNNMVSNQEFRPWELSDIAPRLKYDIVSLAPQVRAVDLMHKAAYRRGLGNSLFISPRKIGSISSESLQHFAGSTLLPSRCGISVIGDNQDKAVLVAQSLKLLTVGTEAPVEKSKFYGGELRKEIGGDLTHVALTVEGAAAGTPESLALAIAAKALGHGPTTKWGNNTSVLAKAIGNIGPFAVAGYNVSYCDTGLFGAVLTIPKDEVPAAVKAVANVLKNPSIDSHAIKAGKNMLKLQVLSEADEGSAYAESVVTQGLYTGVVKSPTQIAQDIDNVSEASVSSALGKIRGQKLAMGAVGNLAFCPFIDEI